MVTSPASSLFFVSVVIYGEKLKTNMAWRLQGVIFTLSLRRAILEPFSYVCENSLTQIKITYANLCFRSGHNLLQDQDSHLVTTNCKKPVRVLHVDDDSSILEISKQILKDMNESFEIDFAYCVEDGLGKLATGNYDVVVSDYEMPQKNGLDFLRELRETKNEIPFVLFTGKGREEVAINALNLGADGYYNKQGSPETVYGELYHGIRMAVARKAAESALIKAQMLTDSIINSTRDFIWSMSTDDFRLLTFNQAMSEHFLKTQNLRLKAGMSALQLLPSEAILQKWRALSKRVLEQGSFTIEYTTWKEPRVLEMTFNLLKRADKAFAIAVFGKDITERKKTEELIKKSEARYRELVDNLPAPIFEVDDHGKVVFANSGAFKVTGYCREDLEKGFSIFNLVPEREWENTKRNIRQSLSGVGSGGNEYTFLRKDGTEFPVIVNAVPIVRDDGSIILRGVFTEITERKKVEEFQILTDENEKCETC